MHSIEPDKEPSRRYGESGTADIARSESVIEGCVEAARTPILGSGCKVFEWRAVSVSYSCTIPTLTPGAAAVACVLDGDTVTGAEYTLRTHSAEGSSSDCACQMQDIRFDVHVIVCTEFENDGDRDVEMLYGTVALKKAVAVAVLVPQIDVRNTERRAGEKVQKVHLRVDCGGRAAQWM